MALITNINLDTGLSINNAYTRIHEFSGTKMRAVVLLYYYINAQAAIDGKQPLKQQSYSFVPSVEEGADNFIKQGYEHIKTLSEFSDALDA